LAITGRHSCDVEIVDAVTVQLESHVIKYILYIAKPVTRAWINPYPSPGVRVCWGWGTGSPGKPQGYP
jgi:hypothetical protein